MVTEDIERAAAMELFDSLRKRNFSPVSTLSPQEWAETVMRMPGLHGSTEPFTFSFAPYQLEPYLALFDPRNIEVDLMFFSRGGKSRILLTAIGFHIARKPCRIAVMWPVEGHAKKWSKYDLMGELIEPTPELAALIEDATGQRKSRNTILDKPYPGGLIQMLGANAPGSMRRIKARLLISDEIDAIQTIENDEGDQLKIFAKRGDEFPDTIQGYSSYPSLKGRSRIESKLLQSDLRLWVSHCLKCGDPLVLHRTGVSAFNDKLPRTKLLYDKETPEKARLECPHCATHHDDAGRYRMMMGGDILKPRYDLWQATRPENKGRAGFHAGSMLWPHPVDPLRYPGGWLEVLARKHIAIEESENPERARRVFVNTDDAETYQSATDVKPDHSKLFLRREAWAGFTGEKDANGRPIAAPWDSRLPVPAGCLAVTFFTDVQDDRLEMFLEGHGLNGQTYDVGKIVINGGKGCALSPPDQGVWAKHDEYLDQITFRHPSGKTLKILGGLVDAGDKRDHVFAYTRPRARRKIFASRGDTELCKPIVEARARKEGKFRTRVWVLGTHAAKDVIYQRLDQDNPLSTGYRHYPVAAWCSETHFKRLTAEDSEDRQARDGKWYKWFGCAQGVRNEELDGAVGNMAALKILKPKLKALAAPAGRSAASDGAGEASQTEEQKASQTVKPPAVRVPKKGFATGGMRPGSGRGFVSSWRR
jgi:phage terminase large subunit GpA-like protein